MTSTLTKNQTKTFRKEYKEDGKKYVIYAIVRYDDQCNNGHNTFSITGEVRGPRGFECGGCIHDEIAKHFPCLAPFIKWHLCSSDGPMHYEANTIYLAGDRDHWGLRNGESKPNWKHMVSEGKQRELDAARRTAVWPEATDEQLCQEPEELRKALRERLPALLAEFREAVESLGFVW